MKTLALDSSALTATVALAEDSVLRGEYTLNTALTHSQTLMPMVDELLRQVGWKITEIDRFVCAKGPGSFTGLRIGIGTVKGLAMGTGAPCVGVSTLKALSYRMWGTEKTVVPIMDARRGEVYAGVYRQEGSRMIPLFPDRALPLTELLADLSGACIFLGDGVPVHRETIIKEMGERASFAPLSHTLPGAAALICAAEDEPSETYHSLSPVYLRKSQAEREYEERRMKA